MKADTPEEDSLTTWLADRLAEEREVLEKRHNKMLQQFQEYQSTHRLIDEIMPPLRASETTFTFSPGNNKPAFVEGTQGNTACEADLHCSPALGDSLSVESGGKKEFCKRPKIRDTFSFLRTMKNHNKTVLGKLVTHRSFELLFATMIAVNMVIMVVDVQCRGQQVGHLIGYEGYGSPSGKWHKVLSATEIADWMFGIMYTVEIILKMIGLRSAFFEMWNVFDTIVVTTFYIEKLAAMQMPFESMSLRLFRLLKVLRFLRLVHEIAGFGQLLLMVTALKGCLRMLAWASLLLLGLQTICAFIFNQLLNEFVVENDEYALAKRQRCFQYFGTFSRSIFSIFELTLGNWVPISRFLVEDVHMGFIAFALGYKLTLGFAVVGVVNACFIKETFKVVATDRNMMVIEKSFEKQTFEREMLTFMAAADTSSDGSLTREEFVEFCADGNVKAWLAAQGLDASNPSKLFSLMSRGAEEMSDFELLKGVAKLKGPAKSLDLAKASQRLAEKDQLLHQVCSMKELLTRMQSTLTSMKHSAEKFQLKL